MSDYTRQQIEKMKQQEAERREQARREALRRNEQTRRLWADEGRAAALAREVSRMIPPATVSI